MGVRAMLRKKGVRTRPTIETGGQGAQILYP